MRTVHAEQSWQATLVDMLPELTRRLRRNFRSLDPASRDEAVAEAVALCVVAFARLHDRARTHVATPSTLAWYSSRQVKRGRTAAGRLNGEEPLSRYAQVSNGIEVEQQAGTWIDEMVEDKRASVPEQVAARVDVRAWFATLSRRMKQIAKDLAFGFSTSEVARKYGVTAGRISQLRRSLEASWAEFQKEAAPAVA